MGFLLGWGEFCGGLKSGGGCVRCGQGSPSRCGVRRSRWLSITGCTGPPRPFLGLGLRVPQPKDELIEVLVEFAREDRKTLHRLATRFELKALPEELVIATRHAIIDATDFDERDVNSNFDYDYDAYEEVKSNLGRLIDPGQPREAMELSLELMKDGSYQVEMSDEGLMTDDIEECLAVVIESLKKCDLSSDDVIIWCSAMLASDRVGFICDRELKSLRNHFKTS